jgi:hypothetical protein
VLPPLKQRFLDLAAQQPSLSWSLNRAATLIGDAIAAGLSETAIINVTKATSELRGITQPDVVQARAQLGEWLRWAGTQLP